MARKYTTGEARQIINRYDNREKAIRQIRADEDKKRLAVTKCAERLREESLIAFMKNIDVDELTREKTGIRVKLLKENGYTTIGDLYTVKPGKLMNISGIGEDSVALIKATAERYAERTRPLIKIKMNADIRDAGMDALLIALRSYSLNEKIYNICGKCETEYGERVKAMIEAALPEKSSIRWMLASKSKRFSADEALSELDISLEQSYGKTVDKAIKAVRNIKRESAEEVNTLFKKDPIPFITILERLCPNMVGSVDSVYGLKGNLAEDIGQETLDLTGLKCTLRRYQEWGVKYVLHQKRVLLGDEMGLGKTVQAIAAMVCIRNSGGTHFLVVCPASVLSNWCREIVKHSDIEAYRIHGTERDRELRKWKLNGGVAVTTYETTAFFGIDEGMRVALMVVDEAHYIKNIEAQRTQHTKRLCTKADRLLFMTGTALENRVDEMIALIRILQPEVATKADGIAFMSQAENFRDAVIPVYYRRRREEVLTELPELIESKEWCTLNTKERITYTKALIARDRTAIRRVSWNMPDINDSSKAKRMLELVEEAKNDGRKVLVFSFYLDTIKAVHTLLGAACYGPITGSVTPLKRQEILDEFEKAPDGSVLIAQIQAGGTGLNIQSASVVIICEPQFKPSIENQAISRSYRMGQPRSVLVYRLLADDTADEDVIELLESKQKIFDSFADISAIGSESIELDIRSFDSIIDSQIEKYAAENGQINSPVKAE